ncbi:MAG: hypothetical protein V7740_18530, partial [Pseudomonas marincola]
MALKDAIEKSHRSMVEGRDVPWLLNQWVTRTPDKPFLIWEPFDGTSKTYTYAEFGQKVDALA